jgi:hypothetical protein
LRTNVVLIDFENVQVKSLALLAGDHFRVLLFIGPNQTKLPTDLALAMQDFGARAQYVKLARAGANALDFHVAYYIGRLTAAEPDAYYHVISKDTGFDALIEHLKERKVLAARSESIETMPCFRNPAAGNGLAARAPSEPTVAAANGLGALVKVVVDDLVKRKASRPRKPATLRSTIRARLGKDSETVEDVIEALRREGLLVLDGDKVTYHLPH